MKIIVHFFKSRLFKFKSQYLYEINQPYGIKQAMDDVCCIICVYVVGVYHRNRSLAHLC